MIMLDLHSSLNTGRPVVPMDARPYPLGKNRDESVLKVGVWRFGISTSLMGITQLLERLLGQTVFQLILPAEPNRDSREQSVGLISNMCGVMWKYQDARDEFFTAAAR